LKLELTKIEEVRRILISYADETEGQWTKNNKFSRNADLEWKKGTKRKEDVKKK
jgi:hypothetical protein